MNLNETLGTLVPDNLFFGHDVTAIVKGVTLAAAQGVLKRGTILAKDAVTGKHSTLATAEVEADCILTDDVDTGAEGSVTDVVSTAYFTGHFNRNALTIGGTETIAAHEDELRDRGIFLSDAIPVVE